MNDAMAAVPASEPDGAPRLATLDILRGIAILGILFMNINDMGQSMTASFGDVRHLGWGLADQIAWWLREVFANGTARALLELLFGAGMVILTDRAATAATRWAAMRRYYWRNIVLWAFGMAHLFVLLWPGDILHTYAVAALIVFLFRRLPAKWLIVIGLVMATSRLCGAGYFAIYQPLHEQAKAAAVAARRDSGQPLTTADRALLARAARSRTRIAGATTRRQARIAAEDKARSGSAIDWIVKQAQISADRLYGGTGELFAIWEAGSTMLIGAALLKLGILQGDRPRRFYWRMMLAGYAVGLPLRTLGAYETTRFDDAPQTIFATYEYARLAMTLGHLGLILLLVASPLGARLLRPFGAAGRVALSIYVAQTVVLLWVVFPPFGFALYGTLGWAKLMLVAAALDAVLLWSATVYLRRYRLGPVEWAWRSIVERRILALRR